MKNNIVLILLSIVSFNTLASQNKTVNRLEMNQYQQHAIVTLTGLALVLAPVSCCYAACKSDQCRWEKKNYRRINKNKMYNATFYRSKKLKKNAYYSKK